MKLFIIISHIITLGIFWRPSLEYIHKHATTPKKIEHYLSYFSFQNDTVAEDRWKSPEQFIKDKGGDCEDYAILAYELLTRIGYQPVIYGMYNPHDDEPGHAICVFEKGLFSNHVLYDKPGDTLESYMKANSYIECVRYDWRTRQRWVRRFYEKEQAK